MFWRTIGFFPAVFVFCALFLMSFYQRPVIWMPAQLLIYIAGIFCYLQITKPATLSSSGLSQEPHHRHHAITRNNK
jgi:hypothetical protein